MSFGGSVQGIITTLKNNATLLRKKSIFQKERSFLNLKNAYFKASQGTIQSTKLTPEELKIIRANVIASQKREFLTDIFLFALFGILIIGFIAQIGNDVYRAFQNPYYKNFDIKIEKIEKNSYDEKYQFYIQDAEKWTRELNYKNAAFQYKNSLEMAPNTIEIEVKYIEAVVNQCYYDKTDCELAQSLLQEAVKKYPNNPILNELKSYLK